jgi:hypothetical protein
VRVSLRDSFRANGSHFADGQPELTEEPASEGDESLPPLDEELWLHGGSYMYAPEGDRLGWPGDPASKHPRLRLPPWWVAPEPLTAFAEFLGAEPVIQRPPLSSGYSLDPQFVAYGSYNVFGLALEQADQRQDLLGQNLFVDLDLGLTGTERFHVQFRPLGSRNSGGSYYQFSDPAGYVDNSTGEPDRYWFEGELHSLLGAGRDPLAARYLNFVVGKFPFALHNTLLMNDEIIGGVISHNNLQLGALSNLNVQWFAGLNDVDTYAGVESQLVGIHAAFDYRKVFYEATYCYLNTYGPRDTHFAAFSRTQFFGPLSLAGRVLLKLGDAGGRGSAQLVVLESNYTRAFERKLFGFEYAVCFCNAFWASEGWNSIAGTNFNRLRTAFEVNPLVRLSTGAASEETVGVAFGAQLFRHHEDESIVPEFAWEAPDGQTVFGAGLRYLRKTGPRTFLEVLGVLNWSDDDRFDREGIFAAHTVLF